VTRIAKWADSAIASWRTDREGLPRGQFLASMKHSPSLAPARRSRGSSNCLTRSTNGLSSLTCERKNAYCCRPGSISISQGFSASGTASLRKGGERGHVALARPVVLEQGGNELGALARGRVEVEFVRPLNVPGADE